MPSASVHAPGLTVKDSALANMYQRLPGHALAAINPLRPCNFAALEVPLYAPRDVIAHPSSNRGDVFSQWKTYTLPHEASLSDALAAIERANSSIRRARKFQLNFTNGAHMLLSRDDPDDASSLVFSTVYNPNTVFHSRTSASVERGRAANDPKLKFLASADGHLMNRRPNSASSFSREKLFRSAPNPPKGHDGFAFSAVSTLSHQLRPNAIIAGVRPGLRETSPMAQYYRPRPVSAAYVGKSTVQAARGATVQNTIYPGENVDHRFRQVPAPPARPSTAKA